MHAIVHGFLLFQGPDQVEFVGNSYDERKGFF